ncbi:aryl-alcohol oxidase-like protein [Sistotremastrum niveocremeum HHB9708]|uniref:Aryl-alcohol oxidase-like protein n=2 Tax=Sistotremastraceae TaxID=3402574 RepID=A0A164WLT4_9AGAM|nr:aryl-alcohol oxidase-like protein [Sistotremastrum niveocremeum HHB9708]KZT40942.1 aryl-alcohol oxidase-like protein [Sistotremastrum suecicum HHB10207 ss-3]
MLPTSSSLPFFLALFLCVPASAKILTDPTKIASQYDFVIVGGGTAGNVVANRLSENPNWRILVVEAGVNNAGIEDVSVPFLEIDASPNKPWTWNYTTVPQTALNGRSMQYTRGKLLGGSSSINYMMYTRGSSDYWDNIAQYSGDEGWSWNSMLPYFKKLETFTPPADHHNTAGEFNPSVHGSNGPLSVSLPGFPTELNSRVFNTTKIASQSFPFNLDVNSGNQLGVGWLQASINDTVRASSAVAYLAPQFISRPNLDVLIQQQVTKVLFSTSAKSAPIATGITFAAGPGARSFTVKPSKEVILCGGSIGSTQLLLLSGIGPSSQLNAHRIPVVLFSPQVGQNLIDHPAIMNHFIANTTQSADSIRENATVLQAVEEEYATLGQGPFVDTASSSIALLRFPSSESVFRQFPDSSVGPNSAHYEFLWADAWVGFLPTVAAPATGAFTTLAQVVVAPASRGSITLSSSSPFDFPIIDPAFLTSEYDVKLSLLAFKSAKQFMAQSPWKGFILGPAQDSANLNTDDEIIAYIRSNTLTLWHPTGTNRMEGNGGKSQGVVDHNLLVKGVSKLRIVDASVFPFIVPGHPEATVYALAERTADLIKAAWA